MKDYIQKHLFVGIAFLILGSSATAKDLYLSSKGADTNNGLTADTPFKTLSKAYSEAVDYDVIYVLDMINIGEEPKRLDDSGNHYSKVDINGKSVYTPDGSTVVYNTWNPAGTTGVRALNKSLTFVGKNKAACGFDGNGQTRIMRIDGASKALTFRNLTFRNGNSEPNNDFGGALYTRSVNMNIENCDFLQNRYTKGQAGAIIHRGGSLSLSKCLFSANLAKFGGAIATDIGDLNIDECIFKDNDITSVAGSIAGALYVFGYAGQAVSVNISRSRFEGNKAKAFGGALAYNNNNVLGKSAVIRCESSLFSGNQSDWSGAFYMDNKGNATTDVAISFINSTFYKNASLSISSKSGAGIFINSGLSGNVFNIINCTMTENYVMGNQGIGGTAVRFASESAPVVKHLYNSIFENNHSEEIVNSSSYGDIHSQHIPAAGELLIENCFIGFTTMDVKNYAGENSTNKINYSTVAAPGLTQLKEPVADYIARSGCIPVNSASPAVGFGKASYLMGMEVYTDQLGNYRLMQDGTCTAGAYESKIDPQGSERYKYKHFIMYGQSLSCGAQSYPLISGEGVSGTYMIGDRVWINNSNSSSSEFRPMKGRYGSATYEQTRRAGVHVECPVFATVDHIQLKTGGESKLVATSCGSGGMTIEKLSKNSLTGNYYEQVTKAINSAARISKKMVSCPAIFWMQGESNYAQDANIGTGATPDSYNTTDKDEYKALLLKLKDDMQNDIAGAYEQDKKPVFITYQVGGQYTRNKDLSIGMSQLEAANRYDDIICAGPVYPVTDRGNTGTGHLDPNGYRWYGEMFAKVYYKTQVLGETFIPLQPKEIMRTNNAKQIKIRFAVPKLPLVLDQKTTEKVPDYGFVVEINNIVQKINSVGIENDCVVLTCANELVGDVRIYYAGQLAGLLNGHGNLRDSDDYPSYFTYVDLDAKDGNGNFVYPRDAGESTLRPSFEPKDENGNVIYGKSYPLYNFCLAFNYLLPAESKSFKIPYLNGDLSAKQALKEDVPALSCQGTTLLVKGGIPENGIELYDFSGTLIKRLKVSGSGSYVLSTLLPGAYVAKAIVKKQSLSLKVIVK